MAIHDLLYACIECGREAGIKLQEDGEVCERCNTVYQRVDGSRIRVQRPDGTAEVKHPAQWLDLLETRWPIEPRMDAREKVILREADSAKPMRHRGIFLGSIEQFGPPEEGFLMLDDQKLTFVGDQDNSRSWRLEDLTAVQPSSTSLQLKVSRGAVLSLKFPEASSLLWEERIRRAIQALYTKAGRGQIREFQPRIVVE